MGQCVRNIGAEVLPGGIYGEREANQKKKGKRKWDLQSNQEDFLGREQTLHQKTPNISKTQSKLPFN